MCTVRQVRDAEQAAVLLASRRASISPASAATRHPWRDLGPASATCASAESHEKKAVAAKGPSAEPITVGWMCTRSSDAEVLDVRGHRSKYEVGHAH